MALNLIVWPIFRVMLVLTFASSMLSQTSIKYNEKEKSDSFNQNLSGDLRMEDIMHQINRIKRATRNFPNYQQSSVFLLMNDTGRCVVSADKASHYCGDIEVTAPPFPPPEAGQCHFSTESGREICWPRYEDLDTTCTDVGSGMVSAPAVKHAAIRAMAFVPPDNLRRLVRQYYRQKGLPIVQNMTFSKNSFLFALYECDYGYEFVDEVNSMFCINRQWVITPPKCRGKGLCEADNGGCSHSCLSVEDREVECRCPHGLVLDSDKKTCIKPVPKNLCRILSSCSCTAINENQYSCTCPKGEKCLLLRGRPKIYIEPAAPYEIMPGGNLNITCSAVSYPFPQIFWQRGDETVDIAPVKPGTVRSEQILIIKELYKNTQFTCHANNSLGKAERTIEIIVTGPGSAPIIRGIDAGHSSVYVRWDPPIIMNRPVISYTVYYTSNSHQPIKNWKKINVDEPNREITIKDLRPNTQYFIRLRANDKLGPGRLSNPVSLNTRKPATRPQLFIQEGETIYVGPLKKFSISCNVTRGDPSPKIAWYTRARPINKPQRKKFITMEHGGLYESTNFSCVAENEAGRTTKRIKVIVTGPTSPERIRYQINGNNVDLQWEPPRITNGPLKDYEVLYTDNPNLSEEYWETAKAGSPDARSLWIPNLKEKKDYTFKIRAHNDLGSGLFSDQFTLTTWLAARPPVVTITPAEKIVKDPSNEELAFECEAIGVPKPKILWLWSGGLVEDGKNEFRIYDVTPPDAQDRSNSKLIAEKTNRAGVATCQAVNAHGSDEKRTEVKIIGPGSPPRDISTIPFTNSFKVSWNPPKYPNGKIIRYIIYYTKNPDDILGDWEKTTVEGDQLEITISADEDTPYSVRVQAATKDGPGIISEVYDVTTGKKPVPLSVKLIILDPQVKAGDTETIVEPLKAIIFKCDAKGRPAPQISYTWLPFNESESGQEPVPIPAYSDPQEAHRYYSLDVNTNTATKRALMCNARNPDGSVSDQHIFNVLKPGSAPENIQAIIDPDSRVTISWHEPKYPNGPIIKYKVYVTSDPAEPISYWRIYDAEPSEAPHLILERGELQPETPYYVRIAAVGQAGEGLQSDIVLFETVSGAPVDAPKDVLATVEHDNTMDISWTGPSVPNGPIQAYTVYFTPLDHHQTSDDAYKQWDKIVVQSSDNSGMLRLNKDAHDILPNQLYRIRVSATNDLSEGPASEPITVKTESGETPPIIRLEPTDNPVTIAPYGSISVRCTATGIPPPIVMWIIGTNASDVIRGPILQLTDLRKDETAICKAENNAGQVQEVLQILVAGPGSPPNEIVAFPLDNQQANIEWTTPDFPNGKIIDYIIHYSEVFDKETIPRTWETIRVSAEEPQKYRLTGLKPKTNYAVRLQAISDRGPGVLSDPIKMTTLPLAPAIVQPADVKVHENNTIAIQFDAPRDPEDPGKPIKEFVVQYTDDDPSSNDAQWKEMFWTEPDDDFSVNIPIGGEHFKPDTKYSIRVTARGEIDSLPSEPFVFQTGDGIIPPEKPQINIDVPDNIIRVPAGSDYTVGCASSGFPAPRVFWVDRDEQPLSDGPMLRLQDVKETIKAKCVAENEGGRAETAFEIFVTGPGNAPSNIHLNSVRPRTIHIDWDPPTIPNGNITRYIIYYTPLDDQNIIYQMGQIPKKPITEWMTSHKDREPLNAAPQRADLIDFIEPDTAYAVVLQAVNQDGPGPYSEQHTIRTMSRAREGPPLDLKVEPEGQRSANVEWHKPITSEQPPIGYELYYIKADAKIWENDLASIDDWNMIPITEKDGDKLYYKIDGSLEPDTEYVFRMRAVYPDGPGVFSDACITKTLPDGNAPYILISNGDHGVEGKTEIMILPGSALDLSCNATGQPRPAVKWIRSGYYPIDPAWVKADEKYAIWFLKVSNITEDTSFNCVAQSPLGFANWTINVRLAPDLLSTWKNDFIIARNENGEVVIHFTDDLPDYLKGPHNPWNIYWTDNPSKPFETWNLVPSDNRLLDRIAIPEMEPGTKYHLVIEQPSAGIKTPVFDIMTPKPASEIRVGTDINGEMVLDFKPALATEPIKKYIIKYWPDDNPSAVMYMETPVNITDKIVLDGLQPDAEYNFMVSAKFDNGDNLPSEPAKIRTPSGDIQCHCAHACMFEEDEEGVITASCYCHNGFKLSDDKKSCEHIEEDEEGGIVQVTPPTLIPEYEYPKELSTRPNLFDDLVPKSEKFDKKTEILKAEVREKEPKTQPPPTDKFGRPLWQDEQLVTTGRELVSSYISPLPIDSKDRVLSPIISFDGEPLPTNEYGQTVDNLGNPIVWDDEGRPIGPNGFLLPRNDKGEYIYPIIGKNGQPLPTDINMKPIYPVVGPDNQPFQKNKEGLHIDQYGQIIPTDIAGRPMSVDGSPYPTDEQGRYIIVDSKNIIQQAVPTDELGRIIYPVSYPDGILLATMEDGRFVDEHGQLIPTNDAGLPINEQDKVLPKDSEGNFVYVGNYVLPTDSDGQPVKVQYNGKLLKSDKMGRIIGPDGKFVPTNNYGHPVDESHALLSTTSDGIFLLPVTDGSSLVIPEREQKKRVERPLNIIGPDGDLLPTMEDGGVLDPFGKIIPTNNIGEPVNYRNEPLPTNNEGQAIYPKDGLDCPLPPTDQHGRPVYSVVGPDGRLLPRKQDGTAVDPDGNLLPTNAAGVPVDRKGRPLPTDRNGSIIYPARGIDTEPLPTDSNGKPVYPVIGFDGNLLPTDRNGRVIDEEGRPLPTNAAGIPINQQGEPLPFDQNGYIRYLSKIERPEKPEYIIIGINGEPLPHNEDRLVIGPDNKPIPTDAAGYPIDHRGRLLPRDRNGNFIYPANGIDAEPMPTDRNGRPVYLVIGPNGRLLPKDSHAAVIDISGKPIPTNAAGVPLDHSGKPLSVDRNGYVIYPKESYATDRSGIPAYTILGPDGAALQQNNDGAIVDPYGRPIPTDHNGYPIDNHGRSLLRDRVGNFIYPLGGLDVDPPPTDVNGRPVYPLIGPNGELLPRGSGGDVLDPYGRPVPTNAVGIPVNSLGEPLPKDKSGNVIYPAGGLDVPSLPTDIHGRPIYEIIDSNGELLLRDSDGIILDRQGKPIPTNAAGVPVDRYGRPLKQTNTGKFMYPMEEIYGEEDKSEKHVYPVIGPDRELLPQNDSGYVVDPFRRPIPTNEYGQPVDSSERPLSHDKAGVVIQPATGLDVEPKPTDRSGKPIYPITGPDGHPLPTTADGDTIGPDGNIVPVNAAGVPTNRRGEPLPRDKYGNFIYPATGLDVEPRPTDRSGKPIYPITGPDGHPLPTTADGDTIGPDGNIVPVNAAGVPTNRRGEPLPRDKYGNFIYPATGLDVKPRPTDRSGKPIYPITGPDGHPLPTTADGDTIGPDGNIVPVNAAGVPTNRRGEPLPRDKYGNFIYPATGLDVEPRPTDRSGKPIYPITGPDGHPLPTTADGDTIGPDGNIVPVNAAGVPTNRRGEPLPRDKYGNFIYPATGLDVEPRPTDRSGKPIYPITGPDGHPLPTTADGDTIGPDGNIVPVNAAGVPTNRRGEPFPRDKYGNFIYPATGLDVEPRPTDRSGKPIYPVTGPDGHPLPTTADGDTIGPDGNIVPVNAAGVPTNRRGEPFPRDKYGNFIYPATGLDVEPRPTDRSGKPIYPVTGPDGHPLPTTADGDTIGPDGNIVPVNAAGVPTNRRGEPLPRDKYGNFIYPATGLDVEPRPTDRSGKPIYPVTGPDGHPLPTTADGDTIGPDGNIVPVNAAGVPTNRRGEPLPRDKYGNFIYPATGLDVEPRPTDRSGKPIYPITGPDGHPLPTTADGDTIGPDGNIVPVNAAGVPTNRRGEPLPRDKYGNFIYPATGLDVEPRPTDRSGKPIYPITGPDGHPLPTTADGDTIGPDGNIVPVNAAGVPTNRRGEPLPRDKYGNFIYPATGLDVEPRPTDRSGKPIYPITGPDGHPLPTTADGDTIGPDGNIVPVNAAGVPTNRRGEPLPRDKYGNFIYPATGLDVEPRPTDRSGKPIYPITGPDGHPLPTTADGDTIGPDGNIVPVNAAGVPTNRRGEPLPRDKYGNFIYPATGLDVEPRPTDRSGKPIYPITGPDGHPLPTTADGDTIGPDGNIVPVNAAGVPTNRRGEPLPRDKYGNFIYPATGLDVEPRPTDRSGKPIYPITGPDGHPLPTTADGDTIGPDGNIVPVNAAGVPTNRRGEPLPRDKYGNFIYPATGLDVEPRPTDRSGKPIYPITGPDGHPLPTTADGDTIGPDGNIVPVNAAGVPTNRRGEPLPRDKYGNFIYPATGLDVEPRPTDRSGKPIYPITGPDGHPLPTTADGDTIGPDGNIVPVNAAGVPTNRRGEPLPRDKYGNFIYPATGLDVEPRPTDRSGKPIYPITGPDGHPLPTTADGDTIGPDGNIVPVNAAGVPTNRRGEPLPRDKYGNFIYPFKGLEAEVLPTDSSGLPIYLVIDSYGQILPTNDRGLAVDNEGKPLPTNAAGVPIDEYGRPLPTDSDGYLIYGKVQKLLSTEESDELIYPIIEPDSELQPTKGISVVTPVDEKIIPIDIELLPTDSNGRPVYPVVGADHELLPTNEDGAVVDKNGKVIPTNVNGIPVDEKGIPLPTDENGRIVYQESIVEAYPTDRLGRRIYKVIGPDGYYLSVDIDSGDVMDPQGRLIPTDESGNLVDMEGRPLPKDRDGNIIYIAKGLNAKPLPTDRNGKPIYSIMGPNKVPLPTNEEGRFVDEVGKLIPTNAAGVPIGNDGKSLPTEVEGNMHYFVKLVSAAPVVVSRRPVKEPEGIPLPTSSNGTIFRPDEKSLLTDQSGWPLDKERKHMPTGVYNNITYPVKLPDSSVLPTDSHGKLVYPVIGPNGELLPTTENGLIIGLNGSPLSTNAAGKPIGPDASLLPTDEVGRIIHLPSEEPLSTFATNEYGHIVYPIVDMDGKLLDKDNSGAFITRNGIPVELNENHLPIDPDGNVLPTDLRGNYIFPDLDIMGKMLSTDTIGRASYPVIGPNGQLLGTDSSGAIIGPDGELLPTNKFGMPVGIDGKPLPKDNEGRFVYSEAGKTHSTEKMIINVVDDRGRVLPTDEFGRYLLAPNYPLQQDDIGRFIGPDGQPLSTDNSGNYVYQDKTKYSSKIDNDFGRPLPTDENGFYVGKDGSMITTELTSFPMDEQGVILPTDESGIFMITKFPTQTKSYQILDEKHQIMPTDEAGNFLDHDGYPIAENEDGKPVYADGVVLPTTDIGYYVFDSARLKSIISTRKSMEDIYSIEGKLLPTDEDGQLITKEETRPGEKIRLPEYVDKILPTDEYGRHIYPALKPDGKPYPTDREHRPIYPIIGYDGKLLPTNDEGLAVDIRGHLIPTNSAGRPLDEDGVILPIDSKGNVVYANERKKCDTHIGVMDIAVAINVETLNYDSFEHVKRVILNLVDEHFDLAPDMTQFAVIKYSGTAEIPITLGGYNEKMELLEGLSRIKIDHMKEHPRLAVGINAAKQQFISFGRENVGRLMIVITDGQDIYPKNHFNDDTIPMLVVGIREFEEEIRDWTNFYILLDSWEQLRADSIAKMIEKECLLGRIFIPIKKASGRLRSEKSENFDGSSPAADELGRVLSIQTSKQIVSATDEYGHVIYPIKDIITDSTRRYADFQESSYPFNSNGNIIIAKRTGKMIDTTNSARSLLYPVIGPDNILSSKDISDVLRSENKLLATARNDLSLMPDASVGGANFHRRPLYSLGDEVLPSDEYNRIYFKSPNGELSSTTETGNFITNQNKPLSIEIDRNGKEIGAKVGPDQILKRQKSIVVDLSERSLSTNRYGDSIYADSGVVPTDASSPIGQNESLMSVDRGQYVSNYMPDRIGLQESELLTDACDKIEESANVILMIESSDSTRTKLNKIKISLLNFIEKNINWRIVKVGIVTYGSTVNVNMDIGNYQNYDDLKESILSLPFIGGTASGDEHAFRTALQLFREKYDNDSGELIVHIFKNPLSKDAQVIASRLKVNESISILSLGPDQWYRLDSDKEIKKLRSDICLMLIKSHLSQTKKSSGELKNKMRSGDGSMIPSESEMADKSLSKDENGHYAQSIAGQDSLFVTDSSGYPIDSFGRFIHHDTVGIPIIPDDRSLSKNDQNRRYTYPTNEINDISLSTDVNRELKYPVKGFEEQSLPTDRTGKAIDNTEKFIPTIEDENSIGLNGSALPTVNNEWFVLVEEQRGKVLPVDTDDHTVYPVIGLKRDPLPTVNSGLNRKTTPIDKYGRLIGVDRLSFKTDSSIKFLLDTESQNKKRVTGNKNGHIKYSGVDQISSPTSNSEILLDLSGKPIATGDIAKPLGPDGEVLPMNEYGIYIYPNAGQDGKIFPTKKLKRPIYSTEETVVPEMVIPTDDQGFYVYPALQPDKMLLSADAQKKIPIIAMNRQSLSTENFVVSDGSPLPMIDSKQSIDTDDPQDPQSLTDGGRIFMFRKEKNPLHSIVNSDGKLLLTNHSSLYPISHDEESVTVTNTNIHPDDQTLTMVSVKNFVYPAITPDKKMFSISNFRDRIDTFSKPLLTSNGDLSVNRGGIIQDNEYEKHYIHPVVSDSRSFPENESRKSIYSASGYILSTYENGQPINNDRNILSTKSTSNHHVYPITGSDERLLLPVENNKPTYITISPNDKQVPINEKTGRILEPTELSTPTNEYGKLIGLNGFPLPTDDSRYVLRITDRKKDMAGILSTGKVGRFLYPVIGPNRDPLSTNREAAKVSNFERSISTDASVPSTDSEDHILPSDEANNYLYPEIDGNRHIFPSHMYEQSAFINPDLTTISDRSVSTTSNSLPFLILSSDGPPLLVDENGIYRDDDGHSLVHIDENGRPVISADGTPLQKTDNGKYFYPYESQKENPLITNIDDNHLLRTDIKDNQVQLNDKGQSLHAHDKSSPEDEHGTYRWSMETTTRYHSSKSGTRTSPSSYCMISSNIDILLLLDASNNARVVDYRIMKDFINNFLTNYFNLQRNYVRVGVMKYGDKVEIPVSLGDYHSETELLSKISESRHMHGEAHLGQALVDAAGEFLVFGSKDIPRIAIIFSNGRSRDDVKKSARLLRDNTKAYIFLVDVGNQGDYKQNLAIVGESNSHRIITIDEWRGANSEILSSFLDELCKLLPQRQDKKSRGDKKAEPTRKTDMLIATSPRICNRVDFKADIMFILDSSDNVTSEEYTNLKESISMLIDEIFDLSPDIVRIGFAEYSDKALVPVPLGYYDKVQLLADISNSKQLGGAPVISRGLHAARQQFQRYGRDRVSKILLLVTSGANRGNVTVPADDLRKHLDVNIFVLVMNTTRGAQMIMNRLTGDEYSQQRVISIPGRTKLQEPELLRIGQALCSGTNMAGTTIWPPRKIPHRTTKRDISFVESKQRNDEISHPILHYRKTTTGHFAPIPLCKDGFLRPYQLSIVIDSTGRSPPRDFRLVLNHVANFLKTRFSPESRLMQLNLVGVDSDGISLKVANFGVDVVDEIFAKVVQKKSDEISPKLGRGIDEAVLLSKEHAIKGVIQIILIISSDGTSSDDAIQSAEYARDQYGHGVVTISIRTPSNEFLKELSLGSSTKVIHFSDWSTENELFHSWIAHAFCSYISTPAMRKAKSTRMTRPPIRKTSKISMNDSTSIEVTPLSPNSLLVSWTCTNNKDYIIWYTPDLSLPKEYWQKLNASCRDSFGRKIDGLPTDNSYTICVEKSQRSANKSIPPNLNDCKTIRLDNDITLKQPDQNNQPIKKCQCICANNGEALMKPTCGTLEDPFRPVATLPPVVDGECRCSMPSKDGRCPSGYFFSHGQCYDVNECQQQNGGCSHGCVNIPGDFYCACPHGMMRDPTDPKMCVNIAASFDRIAAMLGQYLYANQHNTNDFDAEKNNAHTVDKTIKYKATVKSKDDKTISFEWSLMPAVVRKVFKWLF